MKSFAIGTLSLVALATGLLGQSSNAPSSEQREAWQQDLSYAVTSIGENYAYFSSDLDWQAVTSSYSTKLAEVNTPTDFSRLIEQLVEELHDHHAHLTSNHSRSYRLAPTQLDLWADYHDGVYRLIDVRSGSPAEQAGLRGGVSLAKLNGIDFAQAVEARLKPFQDRDSDAAKSWAARTLLAGQHHQKQIQVSVVTEQGEIRDYDYALGWRPNADARLTLIQVGATPTIRIENSLGDRGLVNEFDAALDKVMDAEVLILDLTNTPSGGNSDIARGIMGRFTAKEMPYQRHEFLERPLNIPRIWVEQVAPRGDAAFKGKLLVLVNHWTGSMGEGMTLGLDTLPNSTVIGTPMAGLRGATWRFDLPNTGIGFYIPTQRLLHIEGYPREDFYPDVLVQPSPDAITTHKFDTAVASQISDHTLRKQWLEEVPAWIAKSSRKLASLEPQYTNDQDLAWLNARTEGVQVFAMGESTHGTSEFFRIRHRLSGYLIKNAGFQAIAFESSAATAIACDRYIRGEDVSIKEAVSGLGMSIWQVEELEDLLVDLREMNVGRENPVRFFGVDMQNPGASARHIESVLTRINPDLGARWREPLQRFANLVNHRSSASEADVPIVQASIEELNYTWNSNAVEFTSSLGSPTYLETKRQLKTLQQNLDLFKTSDWSKRDAAMAENTLGIFNVLGEDAKIILWAHNAHVSRGALTYTGTDKLAMGGELEKALGDKYYALGLHFDHGTFQANGYDEEGSLNYKRYHFDPAPEGSLVYYFALAGASPSILDFETSAPTPVVSKWLSRALGVRWMGGYNVQSDINRRTRSASRLMTISAADAFNGLLHIDRSTPASPRNRSMIDDQIYGD